MAYGRRQLLNADFVWGIALALGAALLLILAYEPQKATLFSSGESMVWPRYMLWPLLALSLLLTVRGLSRPGEVPRKRRQYRHLIRPLILSVLTLGCFALVSVIGFLPFTLIFCGAAACVMGRARPVAITVFSVAVTLVVWLAFAKGLGVPLPRGVGVFHDLSAILY